MSDTKNRISIQVGLSGYSFKIYDGASVRRSEWLGAEKVFSTPELMGTYDDVDLSFFTPVCTLVPMQFHDPERMTENLAEVADVKPYDDVQAVEIPEYGAVMLYASAGGRSLSKVISETVRRTDGSRIHALPELYHMLLQMSGLNDYNRIVASYMDGILYLAVAQGKTILLCNSFSAPDFTTAEYYIFMVMKRLQLNPEVSVIYFRTPLTEDQELSLYRYFRGVEKI